MASTERGKKLTFAQIDPAKHTAYLFNEEADMGEASQRSRFGANLADHLQPSWLNIYSKGHCFGIFRIAG